MHSTNLRDDLMFSCLVTGDHPASPGLMSGVSWCPHCPLAHGLAPHTAATPSLCVFRLCLARWRRYQYANNVSFNQWRIKLHETQLDLIGLRRRWRLIVETSDKIHV